MKVKRIKASDLAEMEIPPIRWVVPGLITEGLTILAGKPKLGKSVLMLNLCLAVALGKAALGSKSVEQGDVLYLALEDNERRIKDRLLKQGGKFPASLECVFSVPRADEGGMSFIEEWLSTHKNARLVVIDMLSRFRPLLGRRATYDDEVSLGASLQKMAMKHGVAVLVVMHTRKMPGIDTIDEVMGASGLTGTADAIAVINRGRTFLDATMMLTGRDIEEREVSLRFYPAHSRWKLAGDPRIAKLSRQRKLIRRTLRNHGPMRLKEVSKRTGIAYDSVRQMAPKLRREGLLAKTPRGKYKIAS